MGRKLSKSMDLGSGSIGKLFVKLALPAVVAQVINLLYNLVDRIYVGSIAVIGTDALAGLGVCFPILIFVAAFSALIGTGGAPLASIKLGEKKHGDAEKILNNGFVMLILLGIVLTVVIMAFARDLLKLFGSPDSSLAIGTEYLQIYSIGTIFVMLSLGLNSFISAQGFALTSMLTVTIGAVLNIVLDPLFIFVFDMGVKGAAIATVISQAVSCIWVVAFFFSRKTTIKIKPSKFKPDRKVILSILALGIAPFIMQATESAVQIVFNVQLFKYSGGNASYTACLTIMMSVMQMITLPLNGMGMGAQPLISYNYGAGNIKRVKSTVKLLFIVALVVCVVIWLVCLIYPQVFGMIFSATADVTALIKQFMPIFMMGTIMFCSQFALQSAFLALNQAAISMILALLRKVILLIPLTFLLPLALDIKGIFLAEGIADIAAGIITTLTFVLLFNKILNRRTALLSDNALTSSVLIDDITIGAATSAVKEDMAVDIDDETTLIECDIAIEITNKDIENE